MLCDVLLCLINNNEESLFVVVHLYMAGSYELLRLNAAGYVDVELQDVRCDHILYAIQDDLLVIVTTCEAESTQYSTRDP